MLTLTLASVVAEAAKEDPSIYERLSDAWTLGLAAIAVIISVIALFTQHSNESESNEIARQAREDSREANMLSRLALDHSSRADFRERLRILDEPISALKDYFDKFCESIKNGGRSVEGDQGLSDVDEPVFRAAWASGMNTTAGLFFLSLVPLLLECHTLRLVMLERKLVRGYQPQTEQGAGHIGAVISAVEGLNPLFSTLGMEMQVEERLNLSGQGLDDMQNSLKRSAGVGSERKLPESVEKVHEIRRVIASALEYFQREVA